jgi:O-acetyl-ADP-ribose deacetylase (regulator of RNase III)
MAEAPEEIESLKSDIPVRTCLSKLAHTSQADFDRGTHFHHFADRGFGFEDLADIKTYLKEKPGRGVIEGVVFSTGSYSDLLESMVLAAGILREQDAATIVHAVLPRVDEGIIWDRDQEVADRAAESLTAAHAVDKAVVFLDTFVDHDRGYYPRPGLLDRRYNARTGMQVLSHLRDVLQALGPTDYAGTIASPEGIRAVAVPAGGCRCVLVMPEESGTPLESGIAEMAFGDGDRAHWLDLASGRKVAVELRRSTADPQYGAVSPNPVSRAPGILIMD